MVAVIDRQIDPRVDVRNHLEQSVGRRLGDRLCRPGSARCSHGRPSRVWGSTPDRASGITPDNELATASCWREAGRHGSLVRSAGPSPGRCCLSCGGPDVTAPAHGLVQTATPFPKSRRNGAVRTVMTRLDLRCGIGFLGDVLVCEAVLHVAPRSVVGYASPPVRSGSTSDRPVFARV